MTTLVNTLSTHIQNTRQSEIISKLEEEKMYSNTLLQEKENMLLIQSRQAAMGEMLSMIAHQWRQPLTSMSAIVSTIQVQQALDVATEEETSQQLENISRQIQYLSQTITDFRNFFKKEKEITQIEPSELIDQAVFLIGKLLENNNIELRSSLSYSSAISTYANELQHVFINLIKNAADVLIEKNKEEKWIDIRCNQSDEWITFTISDNGGGIEESIMDRIFEPYFSTKGEKNGTGLGLYMSKLIVDKHLKGSLTCQNSNVGAVFTIKLAIDFNPN
jgi:signal transduction histidine kinase